MTTVELITALFYEVDEQMGAIPKHPEAHLWPSEVVTLGLLHALKGVGNRPFYRWLTRDYRALFPRLPERTREEKRPDGLTIPCDAMPARLAYCCLLVMASPHWLLVGSY